MKNVKYYTYDEIYNRAIDAPCRSHELKAKDNAIYNIWAEILETTGENIYDYEIPEETIEKHIERSEKQYFFDDNGNMIVLNTFTCANCGHLFRGDLYNDNLGLHAICPKCQSSFDI